MAITATSSQAIIDSTAIGRDLITAATVAAAHATLDLEDTAFTYALGQTFEAGITTEAITSAANLVTTLPTGGQLQYYYGANPIYIASATEFRPAALLTSVTLGSATREWSNVYSVDGTFSGDLDTAGTVTAPTFSSTVGDAVASFEAQDPASGYPRALFKIGSLTSITNVALRVAPDVSGTDQKTSQITILTNPTDNSSSTKGGYFRATTTSVDLVASYGLGNLSDIPLRFLPNGLQGAPTLTLFGNDATFDCNVSVDGTLDTEVGGSNRLFNLGSDADVAAGDTEYGTVDFSSSVLRFGSATTGSGVARDVGFIRGGSYKLYIGSSEATIYQRLVPSADASYSLGKVGKAWSGVHSVDGDFSGTVTTDTIQSTSVAYSTPPQVYFSGSGGFLAAADASTALRWTSSALEARKDFAPRLDNTIVCGSTSLRWSSVGSVDGSFSGTLDTEVGGSNRVFNLGSDADVAAGDTEYLDMSWDSNNFKLTTASTGSGSSARPFSIATDSTFAVKTVSGTTRFSVTTSRVVAALDLIPNSDGGRQCGRVGARWSIVNSVDGSFTGTLDTEVGGSNRIFNLGSDADVAAGDTEYLETSFSGNDAIIGTQATGAGVVRDLQINNGTVPMMDFTSTSGGQIRVRRPIIAYSAWDVGQISQRFNTGYFNKINALGLVTSVQTITGVSDTLGSTDHTTLCDCTSNAITINLPAAVAGTRYEIKKTDATSNAVTIDGNGSETIDGATTITINSQYESVTIVCDGTNWFIV